MTERVISLGIIGFAAEVEDDPVLQSLLRQQRMKLRAAYSCRYSQVESFARRLQIIPFGSVRKLTESDSIHGLIWNETVGRMELLKWGLSGQAKHLLLRQKALELCSLELLVCLQTQAAQQAVVVLPELGHRWTPATLRLRELIATKLGPIQSVCTSVQCAHGQYERLVGVVDWLRTLQAVPEIHVTALPGQEKIQLDFQCLRRAPVPCEIDISSGAPEENPKPVLNPPAEIHCERGVVRIDSEHRLTWDTGNGSTEESLDHERTSTDVMLDLFGRRIAGGIIPIPDINEVLRSCRIVKAIQTSEQTGQSVRVDDASLPINHGKLSW